MLYSVSEYAKTEYMITNKRTTEITNSPEKYGKNQVLPNGYVPHELVTGVRHTEGLLMCKLSDEF